MQPQINALFDYDFRVDHIEALRTAFSSDHDDGFVVCRIVLDFPQGLHSFVSNIKLYQSRGDGAKTTSYRLVLTSVDNLEIFHDEPSPLNLDRFDNPALAKEPSVPKVKKEREKARLSKTELKIDEKFGDDLKNVIEGCLLECRYAVEKKDPNVFTILEGGGNVYLFFNEIVSMKAGMMSYDNKGPKMSALRDLVMHLHYYLKAKDRTPEDTHQVMDAIKTLQRLLNK